MRLGKDRHGLAEQSLHSAALFEAVDVYKLHMVDECVILWDIRLSASVPHCHEHKRLSITGVEKWTPIDIALDGHPSQSHNAAPACQPLELPKLQVIRLESLRAWTGFRKASGMLKVGDKVTMVRGGQQSAMLCAHCWTHCHHELEISPNLWAALKGVNFS